MIMRYFLLTILFSSSFAQLITPLDNAYLNHIHVLFEWEQIPETIGYDLQFSKDLEFSDGVTQVFTEDLVHIEKDMIEWDNTYYWRVRASDYENEGPGEWLDTLSFTTGVPLSDPTISSIDEELYANGLTVFGAFFNYFSAAIDKSGREIWNSGDNSFVYYSTGKNGNILGCELAPGTQNNLPGSERTFEGQIIWSEPNNDFLHHDMIKLPNGNYLGIVETSSLGAIPVGGWTPLFQGLGFQADGMTVEFPWVGDKLVEWDKETKEIVWSWSVFDHYNMSDYDHLGGTWTEAYISLHYDWTHVNAVIFDEEESCLYISTRHLSRITKIDYPSGEIIWNLGREMPSGDVTLGNDIGFSFQHSLQKLDNGNLITFDNGNLAPEFRGTEHPISRAIEIEINNEQASIIWSHELAPELFGFASGNAQKLDNGNVLLTTVGGGGRSLEVSADGNTIWEGLYNLSLPDGAVYRANRIPGIFPCAYSIMIEGYKEYDGDVGVYLPSGSSNISYNIVNVGQYPISLTLNINDEANWFDSQSIQLDLHPGDRENVSFSGNVLSTNQGNPIHLNIVPDDHPNKSRTLSFNGFTTPLSKTEKNQPFSFYIDKPYPNPFNPSTTIKFRLDFSQYIDLKVYGVNGNFVETLIKGRLTKGQHSIHWNASNHPSGVYFIQIKSRNELKTQKVVLIK